MHEAGAVHLVTCHGRTTVQQLSQCTTDSIAESGDGTQVASSQVTNDDGQPDTFNVRSQQQKARIGMLHA